MQTQEILTKEVFCKHPKISGYMFIEIYDEEFCIDINDKCPKQCLFNHNMEIDSLFEELGIKI